MTPHLLLAAALGALAGVHTSAGMDPRRLRHAFAVLAIVVGVFLLARIGAAA